VCLFSNFIPTSLAYIRFHGRNEQNWWGSGAAGRFNYLYSGDELKGWVGRIVSMLRSAQVLRIYFNNHPRGQSATNAAMLKELLGAEGLNPQ